MDCYWYVKIGLIILLSFTFPNIINHSIRKESKSKRIRPSKIVIVISGIGSSISIALLILIIIDDSILWGIIPFFFLILSVGFFMYGINWEIILKDNTFIHKNFLGIKKEYSYGDVDEIIKMEQMVKIFVKGKVIRIEIYVQNVDYLLEKTNNYDQNYNAF